MNIKAFKQLEQQSIARGIPIIGREKGNWLYNKVLEIKPNKILELGTANGYSGIILGSKGAELTTIEHDKLLAQEAEENFNKFNINAKIIIGNAREEIKHLTQFFDIIFIDFAKKSYLSVLNGCITLTRKGGFIIADNITFKGCQNYKQAVLNNPKLKTEIINISDGLSCSVKL